MILFIFLQTPPAMELHSFTTFHNILFLLTFLIMSGTPTSMWNLSVTTTFLGFAHTFHIMHYYMFFCSKFGSLLADMEST
jgi:hypothetical protein